VSGQPDRTELRARELVKMAKAVWGSGWDSLSDRQQRGAICEQVVLAMLGQDEETAPPALRRLQQIADRALDLQRAPAKALKTASDRSRGKSPLR
jgi:hypothetical protein